MEVKINQTEKRSWIEVDLDQLKTNYLTYKSILPEDTKIMAVIKADAYGHGDIHTARWLSSLGCQLFAVSNIDEAVGLREAGIEGEILILGYTSPKHARIIYCQNLTQTLVSAEHAKALADTGYRIKCQMAIDTGMNRIGLRTDNILQCCNTIRSFTKNLDLNGIFTHLCVADDRSPESIRFTELQIKKFRNIANELEDLKLPFIHCFNSAGGLFYIGNEPYGSLIKSIVRLGIVLYGCIPDISDTLPSNIKPVLTWKSTISMVKDVPKGESIGYGRTYITTRSSRIATVTTGYADGLNRLLSNKGFVMLNGEKAPIVGRICMDQTLIDVTDIEGVKMGDNVIILGNSGSLSHYADDMAKELGTIGYEILCDISKRVQRCYKTQGLLYTL